MTIEKQVIALCKFRGWKEPFDPEVMKFKVGWLMPERFWMCPNGVLKFRHDMPAFDKDLNAINEFENWLEKTHIRYGIEYPEVLNRVILERAGIKVTKNSMPAGKFRMLNAKADVKLEALVKTLDLWED